MRKYILFLLTRLCRLFAYACHNILSKRCTFIANTALLFSNKAIMLSRFSFTIIMRWFAAMIQRLQALRFTDLLTLAEPRSISVQDCWITLMSISDDGCLVFERLPSPAPPGRKRLTKAMAALAQQWSNTSAMRTGVSCIPIYNLHDVDPYISGASAFILPHLSSKIVEDIRSLRLQNPHDIQMMMNQGFISYGVLDVTKDRILILGNALLIEQSIRSIGDRFAIAPRGNCIMVETIETWLHKYQPKPLGSTLMMGFMGTVYGFECTYVVERVMGNPSGQLEGMFCLLLATIAVATYIWNEVYQYRIFAMAARWQRWCEAIGFIWLLLYLIINPLVLSQSTDARIIVSCITSLGVGMVLITMLSYIGRICYNGLYHKITMHIYWVIIGSSLIVMNMIYQLPPRN